MLKTTLLAVLALMLVPGCESRDREAAETSTAVEANRTLAGEYKKEAETARISLGRDGVAVTITKETQRESELTIQEAEEARRMGEEARATVSQARREAEDFKKEQELRGKEGLVQSAVQQVALAVVSYSTDPSKHPNYPVYTDDFDVLYDYGLRLHPELVYKIDLTQDLNGHPSFRITVRHKDPGPRAFMWDIGTSPAVMPVEPAR